MSNVNPYSLYEVIVAYTNSDATAYADPIQLVKDQMFTVTPVHDTDQQRDSGAVGSGLSVFTHAEIAIQAGGLPFNAMVMMMGAISSTSGSIETITKVTGQNNPYFGAIGVAPTEDGRMFAAGLVKCQLQNDPVYSLDGTTNAWLETELPALAFARDSDRICVIPKIYPNLAAWQAAKPTDGAEFLAWMTL